jgi:hypothetical protein
MDQDPRYVEFGRWREAHDAVLDRVRSLERHYEGLAGAEQIHVELEARINRLEQSGRNHITSEQARRDKAWVVILALISGLVLPLVVGALLTFFHLHNI